MSVLTQAANSYQYYATNNPVLLNSFTGFLIASIGDVLCQKALYSWDKKREREKRNALLTPSQKEISYFDTPEFEKARLLGSKTVKDTSKIVGDSQRIMDQNHHQTMVKSSTKRNVLKNALLPNNIKKSLPVSNNGKMMQMTQMTDMEEKPFKWDSVRTIHLGIIRAMVIAPFVQWWYPVLLRTFPGRGIPSVMGRVVMDQVSGSPLVVIMVFVASAALQGNPMTSIKRIQEIGFSTWLRGLQYWPFVHTIMHTFIPLQHQTLFAHFCSLYWNAVLSYYVNLKME